MFEERGDRPDRRLIARHDRDQTLHVARRKMQTHAVVRQLAPNQRKAHAIRAVQLPI
jgi:hypothetical protein